MSRMNRTKPTWTIVLDKPITVSVWTKGEAIAVVKKERGLKRLPPHTPVVRVEKADA